MPYKEKQDSCRFWSVTVVTRVVCFGESMWFYKLVNGTVVLVTPLLDSKAAGLLIGKVGSPLLKPSPVDKLI